MKKLNLLSVIGFCMFFLIDAAPLKASYTTIQGLGKCKMYSNVQWYANNSYGDVTLANISGEYESVFSKQITATQIITVQGTNVEGYTPPEGGSYVDFELNQHTMTATGHTTSKQICFEAYPAGLCGFVKKGNSLYLMRLNDDAIILTLDDNYKFSEDFSILVYDSGQNSRNQKIYYISNGTLKIFNLQDYTVTSTGEIKEELSETNKEDIYSIDGQRLSTPQKGINIIHMSDGTSKKILKNN